MKLSAIAKTIAELERRREKITHAIAALRAVAKLSDDPPPSTTIAISGSARGARFVSTAGATLVITPTRPGPKPGTGQGRPARHVSDEQWVRARPMWDADDSAEKIGKEIGCSGARVNQYAREKGWRVRDYSAIARKARLRTLAPAADGTQAAKPFVAKVKPRVSGTECPKCHVISPTDPCDNCGRRKGKR